MPKFAPTRAASLVARIAAITLLTTQYVRPQSVDAQQLIDQLPSCSALREEIRGGARGNGVDQPYMRTMRETGIQRALLVLSAVLQRGKPGGIRVVLCLYFRRLDQPDSQITDEGALKAIERSGLSAELGSLARGRVAAAPLVRGTGYGGVRASSVVEFFANPWLPQHNPVLLRSGRPQPLAQAVVNGDALGTRLLVKSRQLTKKDLNFALFEAVLSQYDNSTVIGLLLDSGADVNARAPDGSTPLMVATAHPCNLRPLLDRGADLYLRDEGGRTALQRAQQTKEDVAVSLLMEAGAKWGAGGSDPGGAKK
jgi:hypothetical protein